MQPLSSAHVFHGRYSQFLFIFLQSLAVIFLSSRQNCSTNHFRNQLRSWKQTENKPHIIEFGFRTFFGFLLHIDLALLIFDRWKLFPRMALKMIVAGMQRLWGGLTWGNQLWGVFFWGNQHGYMVDPNLRRNQKGMVHFGLLRIHEFRLQVLQIVQQQKRGKLQTFVALQYWMWFQLI